MNAQHMTIRKPLCCVLMHPCGFADRRAYCTSQQGNRYVVFPSILVGVLTAVTFTYEGEWTAATTMSATVFEFLPYGMTPA